MSNTPDSLLPVVYVSPLRPLGILRVMVTDHRPVHGVDDGVPVTTDIRAHLQSAHRAPLLTFVGALAVKAPEIIRSLGLDKNEIAMRSFHLSPSFLSFLYANPRRSRLRY